MSQLTCDPPVTQHLMNNDNTFLAMKQLKPSEICTVPHIRGWAPLNSALSESGTTAEPSNVRRHILLVHLDGGHASTELETLAYIILHIPSTRISHANMLPCPVRAYVCCIEQSLTLSIDSSDYSLLPAFNVSTPACMAKSYSPC
jgi:hypothetical protein